jgi:hypothetical protein
MGRTLKDVIEKLPAGRQASIDARFRDLKEEVEGLRELREAAGKAQIDVAAALQIKQPSVSKIEKQADMYLSTLRSYVEAMGGTLDLVVRLPSRRIVKLRGLGDMSDAPARRTPRQRAHKA